MEHAPWIGNRYKEGVDGQRLLLLGFSHYGAFDDGKDGPDFTNYAMHKWALKGEIPFFKTLASYFGHDDPATFFPLVAFANILPRSVGDAEDKFADGSEVDAAEIADRFRRLLARTDPDKVIVFTSKGWRKLPGFDDRDSDGLLDALGRPPIQFGGYDRPRPGYAMAYGLRHPLFAPWSMMRASVEAILAHR